MPSRTISAWRLATLSVVAVALVGTIVAQDAKKEEVHPVVADFLKYWNEEGKRRATKP